MSRASYLLIFGLFIITGCASSPSDSAVQPEASGGNTVAPTAGEMNPLGGTQSRSRMAPPMLIDDQAPMGGRHMDGPMDMPDSVDMAGSPSQTMGGAPTNPMGGHTSTPSFVPPPVNGCSPDRSTFDTSIGPHMEQYCGLCHGDPLAFGARYTLTAYDGLFGGDAGARPIDRAVIRLSDGTMPPAGHMRPGTDVREAILDWATCGSWREGTDLLPNPGADFDVDREILQDLGAPPVNTDFFELRAQDFRVTEAMTDHYECFRFEAPVDETRFIRRIETIVNDARVLHHIVLVPDENGEPNTNSPCNEINPSALTYAWAPGQGALQFPEGGLRLEPGQRMTLNIHYNNAAQHPDVVDSSGVRIYHGPVEGPEVAMLTFGPTEINVPPQEMGSADGWCRLPAETNLLYSFPHMHDTGTGFRQVIEGEDGEDKPIITINGWDFDAQYIYETPIPLPEGTVVRTTCTFRNPTDRTIRFGEGTDDEMCFNFSYISPPIGVAACNQNERPTPLIYEPGECAAPGADMLAVESVVAPIREGRAPALAGGPSPDGLWVLDTATLYLPSAQLGPFTLDTERSIVNTVATAAVIDNTLYFDGAAQLYVVAGPLSTNFTQGLSFGGPVQFGGDNNPSLDVDFECGELGLDAQLGYEFDGERLKILAPVQEGPLTLDFVVEFIRPNP